MSLSMICKALAVVILAGTAAPAFAEPAVTQTRLVSTAGLDLHSAGGRALLRHRIQVAARKVCGATDTYGQLSDLGTARCVTDAERAATARADMVTASAHGAMDYAAK